MKENTKKTKLVREATTLSSLDDLQLSQSTIRELDKALAIQNAATGQTDRLGGAIKKGREIAYKAETDTSGLTPKWQSELEQAVRRLGFIRPARDFTITFNVIYVYHIAYSDFVQAMDITTLSNEGYESFESLNIQDIEKVKKALQNRLDSREYDVMYRYFGLDGEPRRNSLEITRFFGWPNKRIAREIIDRAKDKIRWRVDLPILFGIPEDINRPDELYLLGIGVEDYRLLTAAGISDISDILDYARGDRENFGAIGHRCMKNVEEKMQENGYPDFYFPTLKKSAQLSARLRAK